MSTIWKTNDGKAMEIIWMDSVHLYHSWMMTARNGRHNFKLRDELEARGLDPKDVPKLRETLVQLCWVRAIIDSAGPSRNHFKLKLFYENPERWITDTAASTVPINMKIAARATWHRLTR